VARARNIKPGFFENEELAELGPLAMLLFEGLWCLADREGRLEDRPRRIKAQLFPYFRDSDEALSTMVSSAAHHGCRTFAVNVDAMLDALYEREFIIRYTTDGVRYIQVVNFEKHQRPHSNETPSTIPPQIPDCLIVGCRGARVLTHRAKTPRHGDYRKTGRSQTSCDCGPKSKAGQTLRLMYSLRAFAITGTA
jgi:hypothetical protein